MKKQVFLLAIFLILILPLVYSSESDNKTAAYDCLLSKVEGSKCNSISNLEDKIFALWATRECKTQIMEESDNDECWPDTGCDVETTAKALIGLKETSVDKAKIANWILTQTETPDGLEWFLQVDSNLETTCSITDSNGGIYNFRLGKDKKIYDKSSTGCFTPYRFDYWLKIDSSCFDYDFTIKCNQGFTTNLLYKQDSDVQDIFYIASKTSGADVNGETTEQVSSYCFGSDSCDYEASLWATLALDYLDYDIKSYLPYLIAKYQDYPELLPEAFIYHLKAFPEFRNYLLDSQNPEGYWGDFSTRYYDTALALLPFANKQLSQKTLAKKYLMENQRASGCFGDSTDNVGDTGFILFSIWPKSTGPECYTDSECSGNEVCLFSNCVPEDSECVYDRHCPDGVCIDNMCENCRYDEDCGGSLICSNKNTCVECELRSDCSAGFGCDNQNKCFELPDCVDKSDCAQGEQCVGGYCIGGYPECANDSDCYQFNDEFCLNNSCVECILNSHCGPAYECVLNSCIALEDECDNDDECGDDEYCDDSGVCLLEDVGGCVEAEYFCRTRYTCLDDGGSLLKEYSCSGVDWCCDTAEESKTCTELNGELCDSGEKCKGGQEDNTASDKTLGKVCCRGGVCEKAVDVSDCQFYNPGAACRSSCFDDEDSVDDSCTDSLDTCCVAAGEPAEPGGSSLWIWILLILIILVGIGIYFRDKLTGWYVSLKSRFFGGNSKPSSGGFPPFRPGPPMLRRPIPRRILPPTNNRPIPRRPFAQVPRNTPSKPGGELKDVLDKLKNIGK